MKYILLFLPFTLSAQSDSITTVYCQRVPIEAHQIVLDALKLKAGQPISREDLFRLEGGEAVLARCKNGKQ